MEITPPINVLIFIIGTETVLTCNLLNRGYMNVHPSFDIVGVVYPCPAIYIYPWCFFPVFLEAMGSLYTRFNKLQVRTVSVPMIKIKTFIGGVISPSLPLF